jgi:hypothetical protein
MTKASRICKRVAVALMLMAGASGLAQPLPLESQLPAWATKPWAAASAASRVELFAAVNPFYQRGDFDGDGRADLAILVRDRASGKIGILVLHRSGRPALLGAGRNFGNGGDDFAWIDQWSVDDGGKDVRRNDPSPRRAPDALWVAKEGSASALIRYRNGKYVWQQQGD